MVMGRPSTYPRGEALDKLKAQILELAREGKSLAQISARVDIPRTTLLTWADQYDDFSTTLTRAKDLEQDWWEDAGQKGLLADKFNAQVWKKSVEARFKNDYTERKEVGGVNGEPIPVAAFVLVSPDED